MKRLFAVLFLTCILALKGFNASAQTAWEQGWVAGYEFAMEKLKLASDAHPEWALVLQQNSPTYFNSQIITYTVIQDDYQRAMLASGSVNTDYGDYIASMKDVNDSWNGYYYGFHQAKADFVIGP